MLSVTAPDAPPPKPITAPEMRALGCARAHYCLLIDQTLGVVMRWSGICGCRRAGFGEQQGRHRPYVLRELGPEVHQSGDLFCRPAGSDLNEERTVVPEYEHRPFGHIEDLLAALTGQLGVERDLVDLFYELVMLALGDDPQLPFG